MIPSPRTGLLRVAIASLALSLSGLSGAQAAADAERGKVLYETRCSACHGNSVHKRDARKAKSFDGLRAQVLRWTAEAGGSWSAEEIDDLTLYLNQRYYHFPCPPGACKPNQALLSR
jgi:mono/diheme cytochrome c family protein